MKNFFTSMLGTLAALAICAVGAFAVFLIGFGILAAMGSKKPVTVESGSFLVFDLSSVITDAPPKSSPSEFLEALNGDNDNPKTLQLRLVTHALQAASKDARIKGVFVHGSLPSGGSTYGNGFAALKEVREALLEVKTAGKPVLAYLNFAGTRESPNRHARPAQCVKLAQGDMLLISPARETAIGPYALFPAASKTKPSSTSVPANVPRAEFRTTKLLAPAM